MEGAATDDSYCQLSTSASGSGLILRSTDSLDVVFFGEPTSSLPRRRIIDEDKKTIATTRRGYDRSKQDGGRAKLLESLSSSSIDPDALVSKPDGAPGQARRQPAPPSIGTFESFNCSAATTASSPSSSRNSSTGDSCRPVAKNHNNSGSPRKLPDVSATRRYRSHHHRHHRQKVVGSGCVEGQTLVPVCDGGVMPRMQRPLMEARKEELVKAAVSLVQQAEASTETTATVAAASGGSQGVAQPPQPTISLRYGHRENANVFVGLAAELFEEKQSSPSAGEVHVSCKLAAFYDAATESHPTLAYTIAYALRCKYPCYVVALMYLEKIKRNCGGNLLPSACFHRLLCTISMLAVKFYDDLYFSNEHYASGFRMCVEVLNRLEIEALKLLNFGLKTNPKDFKKGMVAFDLARKTKSTGPPGGSSGLNTGRIDSTDICLVAAVNVLGWEQFNKVVPLAPGDSTATAPTTATPASPTEPTKQTITATPRRSGAAGIALLSHIQKLVRDREWNGLRYEYEEEKLHKRALFQKSQHIQRLVQEATDIVAQKSARRARDRGDYPPPEQTHVKEQGFKAPFLLNAIAAPSFYSVDAEPVKEFSRRSVAVGPLSSSLGGTVKQRATFVPKGRCPDSGEEGNGLISRWPAYGRRRQSLKLPEGSLDSGYQHYLHHHYHPNHRLHLHISTKEPLPQRGTIAISTTSAYKTAAIESQLRKIEAVGDA